MSDPSIRSCVRGLELLRILNANNYSTALQLSKQSSLPRPTVYRLLETLIEAGFVARDEFTDVFYVTSRVTGLASGYGPSEKAIQHAKPRIKEFSDRICWPSYLHELVNDSMVTRAIIRSPRAFAHPKIGARHSLHESSSGRAFLASLPQDQREALLYRCVRAAPSTTVNMHELNGLLRDAALLGCGFREGGFLPRTCSLAIPIRYQGKHVAYWTIVIMSSAYSVRKAIDTYLEEVQEQVAEIERELDAATAATTPLSYDGDAQAVAGATSTAV